MRSHDIEGYYWEEPKQPKVRPPRDQEPKETKQTDASPADPPATRLDQKRDDNKEALDG